MEEGETELRMEDKDERRGGGDKKLEEEEEEERKWRGRRIRRWRTEERATRSQHRYRAR